MAVQYRQIPGMEVLSCTDPFEFKPHIHDRWVIWLNTGCGEHYRIKGESDILQPGSISIFEPGLVHANRPCATDQRQLCSFYVTPDFLRDLAVQCGDRENPRLDFGSAPLQDTALWQALAALHTDFFTDSNTPELEGMSVELFTALLTRHGNLRAKGNRTSGGDRCDKRVIRAIDYFQAHLSQEIRLTDLANHLGCTQYHLIRLFRSHKGLSPHAFLLQLRLEHGRRLLEEGAPIAEAAAAAGFADQSHLTRAFKRRFGVTPKIYQTNLN
ncbi:MAG: AraC family transcriptional regulator [Desulfobacterales bacterium]|nr:AraC family transcriptional regulator [Desulfobacterales bacterium]